MSDAVSLPITWRPLGTRLMGGAAMTMLVVVCLAAWIFFPPEIRAKFTALQIGTIVFLCAIAGAVWLALVRSRVTATATGLIVVNGFRRREYEWAQLISVSLRKGAPWATLDVSDGETISMMGIQGSDGQRAIDAAREVRALIRAHSGEPPQR